MFVKNITIQEMRRIHREAGFTFLSPKEMKKRGHKIEISPDYAGYFSTSRVSLEGEAIFTIRKFNMETGEVVTVESGIQSKQIALGKIRKLRAGYCRPVLDIVVR